MTSTSSKAGIKRSNHFAFDTNHLTSIVLNWMLILGNQANFLAHAWPKMAACLQSFSHCDLALVSDLYFPQKAPKSVNRTMKALLSQLFYQIWQLINKTFRLMYYSIDFSLIKTTDLLMEQKRSPWVLTALENNAFCVDRCDFFAFDRNMPPFSLLFTQYCYS